MNSVALLTFFPGISLGGQDPKRQLNYLKEKHNKDQQHFLLTRNKWIITVVESGQIDTHCLLECILQEIEMLIF